MQGILFLYFKKGVAEDTVNNNNNNKSDSGNAKAKNKDEIKSKKD